MLASNRSNGSTTSILPHSSQKYDISLKSEIFAFLILTEKHLLDILRWLLCGILRVAYACAQRHTYCK